MITADDFKTCEQAECDFDPEKVDADFLAKLQEAERIGGFEFVITSGYRCKSCNMKTPNSSPSSKHMTYQAVDVAANDALERGKIIDACKEAGLKSFTFSKRRRFIHISNGSLNWISAYDN